MYVFCIVRGGRILTKEFKNMEYLVMEISKEDQDILSFVEKQDEIEIMESDNFGGETLVVSVLVPLVSAILPIFIERILDRKKSDLKRVIVTPTGKYELVGYTTEEAIRFINELKDKTK